ncbi:MAG: hypothetical protein ACQEP8_05160 [Chlamydiota bacterium]
MGALVQDSATTTQELQEVIDQAMQKIGGKQENVICKYLPVDGGGYMHHFTFRKMKSEEPQELQKVIEKKILTSNSPAKIPPKRRAPRGSRKRLDQFSLSRKERNRMIQLARAAGEQELVTKLLPKRSLASIKKELQSSIRKGKVEQELWDSYVEAVQGPMASDKNAAMGFSNFNFPMPNSPFTNN